MAIDNGAFVGLSIYLIILICLNLMISHKVSQNLIAKILMHKHSSTKLIYYTHNRAAQKYIITHLLYYLQVRFTYVIKTLLANKLELCHTLLFGHSKYTQNKKLVTLSHIDSKN